MATNNYNTVSFDGIGDSLTNYISLDNKESVIIGEDSGKIILVSSFTNTLDNTFIGNKSGEFANNISKTILIGKNSGKYILNGVNNIVIGNDNNSNIEYFNNSILIGTSNIGYISNYNINMIGNYNSIENNIDDFNKNSFILGNNNLLKNTENTFIIGNDNKIENISINSNYLYIGNDLINNSNIIFNINNILYETNNEIIKDSINYTYNNLHIANTNRNLIIGYDNIYDINDIINKNIDEIKHNIYTSNGLSAEYISFRNKNNNNITIYNNDKLISNISYILPDAIDNFNLNSTYLLTIDNNYELSWFDSELLNTNVYFNNISNYINEINNRTSNFDNSNPNILQLNSDFYINGILTVDKINLTQGTAILTRDDLDITTGPAGPRGLQGLTGNNGEKGDDGEKGERGDSISDIIYNNETGIITIISSDGYEFQTGDVRGAKGDGYTNGYYNTESNTITFLGTKEELNFTTGNLKGETGPQGVQGETGIQGIQGEIGPQGLQGETGQGIQGEIGPQGIQGEIGPQGLQGETGQGIQGEIGPQGVQGETGIQGIQGEIGPQGVQGEIGPQGVQGETGIQGIQGEIGPQGVQGVQGETGIQGIQGETGSSDNEITYPLRSSSMFNIDEVITSADGRERFRFINNGSTDIYGKHMRMFVNNSPQLLLSADNYVYCTALGYSGLVSNRSYWGHDPWFYTSSYNFTTSFKSQSSILTGTFFITSSDERIKKDITDLDDRECLNKLLALKPKKYKYKDTHTRGDNMAYGFIAQEVEEVVPDLVKTTPDAIPNLYYEVICDEDIITIPDDKDYIGIVGTKLSINDYHGAGNEVTITEYINDKQFKIDTTISTTQCFLVGEFVSDFKKLNKCGIHALSVSSIQELYKIIMQQQEKINELEAKINMLINHLNL